MESLVGKQYEVIKEDEELIKQFPELVKGFRFQVLTDAEDGYSGTRLVITSVICLDTAKVIRIIDNPDSWFYCFWCNDNILSELQEIGHGDPVAGMNEIKLNHFGGKIVPISMALRAFAGQENCDSEEYDTMQKAAEYIVHLEGLLNAKS
ncbi:inhibitor of host Lon protease [Escherichia phage EcS1]|uniref:Inhibitor of host Lon protease n=1 Tax=Escherichia phage EcS1 TaxID=2083276 RepID=A0A2Z5ZCD8_9CAUD|nr:inhibitor of host Lon protease [Escherichia phage EcS1]BBC78124.1 Inhibitor of host Lon protease [Escherichia phage EcS1]